MTKKTCELCGKSTSTLYSVKIDKSVMYVCSGCRQYGVGVRVVKITKKPITTVKKELYKDVFEEIKEELVPDYGKIIRNAREKCRLTPKQLAEKISEKKTVISKIEAETMIPTIELAKKIERTLNIKILEKK